jgi:uncharacterized protein involved in outer membrane biogenesis
LHQLIPVAPPTPGRVIPNPRLPAGADLSVPLELSLETGRLNARDFHLDDFDGRVLASETELALAPVRASVLGGRIELKLRSRIRRSALRFSWSQSLDQLDLAQFSPLARSGVRGRLSSRAHFDGSGGDLYRWLASARGELQVLMEQGAVPGNLIALWGGGLLRNLLVAGSPQGARRRFGA